jgi:hypothetical protein
MTSRLRHNGESHSALTCGKRAKDFRVRREITRRIVLAAAVNARGGKFE